MNALFNAISSVAIGAIILFLLVKTLKNAFFTEHAKIELQLAN